MRQENVIATLKEVIEQIDILMIERQAAEGNSSIQSHSKPKVAGVQEHLRRVMEYVAKDTYDLLRKRYAQEGETFVEPKGEIKFEVRKHSKDFKGRMNTYFAKLDFYYPEIYILFESVQPYKSGSQWAFTLFKDANQSKHNDYHEQQRIKKSSLGIGNSTLVTGISNATFTNCVFVDGKNGVGQTGSISFAGGELVSGKLAKGLTVETKSEFRMKGSLSELITMLKLYLEKVEDFQTKFYTELAKHNQV